MNVIPDEMLDRPAPAQVVYQLTTAQVIRAIVTVSLLCILAYSIVQQQQLNDVLLTLLGAAIGSYFDLPD
jgi:integral membrane sensor domain MASE1